jgi:hypothetical protein
MAFDKSALLSALEQDGVDQSKVSQGGGEYTPPAAGPVRLRFFSYVELGRQEKTYKGVKKTVNLVRIGFELSGPKHPPKEDGTPHTMFIEETLSDNEKAHFVKLFGKMNKAKGAKHMLALLGNAYMGTITHSEVPGRDGGKARTFANLRDKGETYQITLPEFVDPETGDLKKITVAPLVNQEQVFIWSRPDLEQWASIFIEGEYPARTNDAGEIVKKASSKNVIQARIMKAQNFKGSPIETLLKTNGKGLDIPDAETEPEDTGLDDTDETTKIPGQTDPVKAAPTGADADAALAAALGG